MCPYARFQGVMFDADTLTVSYDAQRGEPRGTLKKDAAASKGDCIDCTLCVQVCPTGIDIRNGLQYECINCAACIDACDTVMDKIGAPRGLIRFASENGNAQRAAKRPLLRPRVLVYSGLMLLVLAASAVGFALRQPFQLEAARDRAFLVRESSSGWLENGYTFSVLNTRPTPRRIKLSVEGLPLIRLADAPTLLLAPGARARVQLRVQVLPDYATRGSHPIRFVATAVNAPGEVSREQSSFIGE
jgi:cytochrome c oxidase accessory protein FixG